MNQREKTLLLSIGLVVLAFGTFFALRSVLVKPLVEIDKRTAALREKLEKVKAERRAYFTAEEAVKHHAQLGFSDRVDQASAKSGEMLTKQILFSRLRESDFSRMPVGPRRMTGASEIGWSVQGEGRLDHVVNLLYVLQQSPYLHRLESLVLTPTETPAQVRVRFRYLTLVMDPAPIIEPVELKTQLSLNTPERRILDAIAARDLLRPYIPRSPFDRASAAQRAAGPSSPTGPESLRVVSLSEWMGQPEIHVLDTGNQKTLRYKSGDELAGGTIVMVDYRPLPFPDNVALKSFSRVILKIGDEFWAIERGRTLADKHKLATDLVPPSLTALAH